MFLLVLGITVNNKCLMKLHWVNFTVPFRSQHQDNLQSSGLTTEGEVHTGCSKNDALFGINCYFPVCTKVIQTTLGLK